MEILHYFKWLFILPSFRCAVIYLIYFRGTGHFFQLLAINDAVVTSLGHVSLPLSLVIYLRIDPPAEFLEQRAWTLVHVANSLRVGQLSIKCHKLSSVEMWSNPLTFPSRFRA